MVNKNNEEMFKEIKLSKEESNRWINFHEKAYKQDKKIASKILIDSPRWSVIIAYYSMHNITKLYLAKIHNLKITGKNIHAKTLFFISKYVKKENKKIIPLLKKAKKEYDAITSSSIWLIPRLLKKGRDERSKTQYYDSSKAEKSNMELMQTAQYFIDNFMKPYIEIMEELINVT
ncbi:MAG: hypothetical protein MAG795_00511 [Candidatus Woesearchaeota archaeon]|nr:hypothetical protein [Candidatus Woesearchaeota archaeon]